MATTKPVGGHQSAVETRSNIPLSDLLVDEELLEAVRSAVASGWWSMGPRVAELERELAGFFGTKHALAVANGTAALHLALLACGCGPGDEVVLPSLNFVAAANTIRHVGATPVFCDINGEHDLNLDPDDVEEALGPRTKAIVALHYGGYPCDMEAVLEMARERGLVVIEDAAHAPGARVDGRMCGALGDVGCFSFFSNKNLPVGEAGAVVTDDDEIAERIRLLRSHGMTTLTWDRHRGHAHTYDVVAQGFNYRLDELHAAIALVQLGRLDDMNAARAAVAARYRALLAEVSGVIMPFEPAAHSSHHLAVVVLPPTVDRDRLREEMRTRGVQTSVHYPPIHSFSLYRAGSERLLRRTEDVAARLVTLPLFPHMTDDEVDRVVEALLEACERPA
jgi:dTDP-4-amino-4,6-dideoxygalactose transaminase